MDSTKIKQKFPYRKNTLGKIIAGSILAAVAGWTTIDNIRYNKLETQVACSQYAVVPRSEVGRSIDEFYMGEMNMLHDTAMWDRYLERYNELNHVKMLEDVALLPDADGDGIVYNPITGKSYSVVGN